MQKTELSERYIKATLLDGDLCVDEKIYLPVEDKKANLPKDPISFSVQEEGKDAIVTLSSGSFKRHVYVDSDLVSGPWSDNFMDLEPGVSKTIRVGIRGVEIRAFSESIRIKDLSSIDTENSVFKNKLERTKMFLRDKNWLTYITYKLILS